MNSNKLYLRDRKDRISSLKAFLFLVKESDVNSSRGIRRSRCLRKFMGLAPHFKLLYFKKLSGNGTYIACVNKVIIIKIWKSLPRRTSEIVGSNKSSSKKGKHLLLFTFLLLKVNSISWVSKLFCRILRKSSSGSRSTRRGCVAALFTHRGSIFNVLVQSFWHSSVPVTVIPYPFLGVCIYYTWTRNHQDKLYYCHWNGKYTIPISL